MRLLSRFLSRPKPERPDAVIVRRAESERAKSAAKKQADAQRLLCLTKAATLGRVTTPMTPRAVITEQVQAERQWRKQHRGSPS